MKLQLLGLVGALCVSACATPYVATPYDRETAMVDSMVIVDDAVPEKAIAYEVASVGSNFGLIGALVDAGIQAERQGAVNEALTTVSFDAEGELERLLMREIGEEGYTVALLPGQARTKRDWLPAHSGAAEGVDAYLDVAVMEYGYMSPGAGQPFRPYVWAKVKLVRAGDGALLMENQIVYNPLNVIEGVITIPPNPEFFFNNRSALLEDPNRLAAGIEDALERVAATSAQLLR
jgi:hypothetical protein